MARDPVRSAYHLTGILAALLSATACGARAELDIYPLDASFELTDHNGKTRQLEDFRGQVVLLYFGFTNCPDYCPRTLSKIQHVYRILGPRADNLQTLMITVDPEADVPARLEAYLSHFDIDALGLTGSGNELQTLARGMGARFERVALPESALDYTVDHSLQLYLLDQQGRVRYIFSQDASAQEMADVVEELLPLF